ncbi:MAG: hypothetical protein ACPGWR_29515 [Ardenticatenaceae bacterium]
MLILVLGSLVASFIITGMTHQMFPDGRFPLMTVLLVIVLSAGGAYAGQIYLGNASVFTGAFIGAGISSSLLFYLFDQTGILAQEPRPEETQQPNESSH